MPAHRSSVTAFDPKDIGRKERKSIFKTEPSPLMNNESKQGGMVFVLYEKKSSIMLSELQKDELTALQAQQERDAELSRKLNFRRKSSLNVMPSNYKAIEGKEKDDNNRRKSYVRTTPLANYGAKTGGVEFVLHEKGSVKDNIQESY